MINKIFLAGNIASEPEMRSTQSGLSILGFCVAVNERKKNGQTGEWEEYPNFIDCKLFGKRAESISRFLAKGMKVSVEGRLHQSRWQANDGSKRSKIEVNVDEIEFMSQRQQGQQQGYQQRGQQPQGGSVSAEDAYYGGEQGIYDMDIPF